MYGGRRRGILRFGFVRCYFTPTSQHTQTQCHSLTFTHYQRSLSFSYPPFDEPISLPPTLFLSPEVFPSWLCFCFLFLPVLPPSPCVFLSPIFFISSPAAGWHFILFPATLCCSSWFSTAVTTLLTHSLSLCFSLLHTHTHTHAHTHTHTHTCTHTDSGWLVNETRNNADSRSGLPESIWALCVKISWQE